MSSAIALRNLSRLPRPIAARMSRTVCLLRSASLIASSGSSCGPFRFMQQLEAALVKTLGSGSAVLFDCARNLRQREHQVKQPHGLRRHLLGLVAAECGDDRIDPADHRVVKGANLLHRAGAALFSTRGTVRE